MHKHDMRPVYTLDGEIHGWMCRHCNAGAAHHEALDEMQGELCHPPVATPWSGIALVALSITVAAQAAVAIFTQFIS